MTDPNDPRYHYPIPPEAYPGGDPAGMPPLPDPYRLPRNLDFSALYQQIGKLILCDGCHGSTILLLFFLL